MTGAPRIHQPAACDQALELVRDEQSAATPLDPSAPVYRVVQATTGRAVLGRQAPEGGRVNRPPMQFHP